ncbi:MAG: hypothetical protein LBQ22_04630 [Bacteroidales bacterium]|jgi:hypothetical protein|nr:hypothetical protein [Bacteroidales bacterium]
MTVKDFFRLLIRVLALYFLIQIALNIPFSSFSFIPFIDGEDKLYAILILIVSLGLLIGLFIFIIFNSDKIIHWLKLDKGYDNEEMKLKDINAANLIGLAILITGSILIVWKFISLQDYIIDYYFETINKYYTQAFPYLYHIIADIINIIIGWLLITNYMRISTFLLKINNKNEKSYFKKEDN